MAKKFTLKTDEKDYIVIYESQEHFEVLGWVKASNLEEAIKNAEETLINEIKKYSVKNAEIAEWKDGREISFNIE
ncbi:MAG: hypothetical protein NT012_01255 [Candidatus Nealsonbacteria bacterium]|nr:hypothetical protein [Candidatus Nealsonbacteria bacterium]